MSVTGTVLYGAVVGLAAQFLTIQGPMAAWLGSLPLVTVPLALSGAFLLALVVRLPSFYFYTQLSGLDASFRLITTQALRVQDNPLILSVKKDGTYFLGRSEIQIENLVSKLEAIFEARASKEIYLRADRAAPYGTVVKAMSAAREAGSNQLGIVTEPET